MTVKLLFGPVTVIVAEYVPSPVGTSAELTVTPTVAVPDGGNVPPPGLMVSHSVPSGAAAQVGRQLAGLKMMNALFPPGATLMRVVLA